MAVELRVEGDALKALQRKLKEIDRKDLRRELNKGLREGAKDMPKAAQGAAKSSLPRAGRLNVVVAARPVKLGVVSGGVRVRYTRTDRRMYEQGRLRHPVFGNREVWVTQWITPGWFTDRMRSEARKVRPELVKAMDRIAEKIARA